MYGGGVLGEVMLLMMNVVMKIDCCPLDWKRSKSTGTPPQRW